MNMCVCVVAITMLLRDFGSCEIIFITTTTITGICIIYILCMVYI